MTVVFRKKITAKFDNELAELIERQIDDTNIAVSFTMGDRNGLVSCSCSAFLYYDKNGIVSLSDSNSNFTFAVEKFSIIGKNKLSLQSKTGSMQIEFNHKIK